MREQPRTFDELAVAITSVGEDAGTLDASSNGSPTSASAPSNSATVSARR
jgi:hypothetical protein